jgi:hypothetical protein
LTISRRRAIAGSALLLATGDARADGEASDLIARVGRARASVRTLQGPFEQRRTIGLLATEVRSHGTLTLVRPDYLRWDLAPPDDVTFWVGPEGLAYRSAHGHGRAPASSARIGGALDDLRAVLGGDLAKLHDRWELRVLRDDTTGAELEATPRSGALTRLLKLRFSLASDLARPTRALLVETPRDRTAIDFGALVANAPVDDALMRPPA